jgi:hypothetical protein
VAKIVEELQTKVPDELAQFSRRQRLREALKQQIGAGEL